MCPKGTIAAKVLSNDVAYDRRESGPPRSGYEIEDQHTELIPAALQPRGVNRPASSAERAAFRARQ
jgi:hypothetical protein